MTNKIYSAEHGTWAKLCVEALDLAASGKQLDANHRAALERVVAICDAAIEDLGSPGPDSTFGRMIGQLDHGDSAIAASFTFRSDFRFEALREVAQRALAGTDVTEAERDWLARPFEHVHDWAEDSSANDYSNAP